MGGLNGCKGDTHEEIQQTFVEGLEGKSVGQDTSKLLWKGSLRCDPETSILQKSLWQLGENQ